MSKQRNDSLNDGDLLPDDEATWEAKVRLALHRQDCPETMELGKYQFGLLVETDQARLTAHLEQCPYCQAELARLAEFLAEEEGVFPSIPAVEDSTWTRRKGVEWQFLKETGHVLFRLAEETLHQITFNLQQALQPPTGRLVYGPPRGQFRLFETTLKEEVEDFEAIIAFDTNWADPKHCALTVAVDIPSRGGWPHLGGTEIILKQNEAIIGTKITNSFGQTVFEGIATDSLGQLTLEIIPGEPKR